MSDFVLDIILTTFNRLDYTKRTIDSLLSTIPVQYKLIVVDNASTEEGFQKYLDELEKLQNVEVVRKDANTGWGSAVNLGLTRSSSEWVLVSNNDCIYKPGWYETAKGLYDKYGDKIGILGLWKHTAHRRLQDLGDLWVKDNMPAVAWLLKRDFINNVLQYFPEHGPCLTKGGNGEDVTCCIKTMNAGYWVCAPNIDVVEHIDGY